MLPKLKLVCAAVMLIAAAVQAQERVVLVPGAGSAGSSVTLLEPGTLADSGVLQAYQGAFTALASPDGRLFVLSSTEGGIWLTIAAMSGQPLANPMMLQTGTFAGAQITPDGKLLLLLMDSVLYAYDITSSSATLANAYDVGLGAKDLGVSHDSRWAYVLNPAAGHLVRIDLLGSSSGGAVVIPADSRAVAVGPNGLVYVSATGKVIEIDASTGRAEMAVRRTIDIASDFRPDRAVFTPDGKRLLVANLWQPSSVIAAVYNIETGKLQTVPITTFPFAKLIVPSNDFAYGLGQDTEIYVFAFADLAVSRPAFAFTTAVKSIAASSEASRATSLYVVTQEADTSRKLTRVDLNTFGWAETADAAGAADVLYAAGGASGQLSKVAAIGQTQKVAPGERIAPLVVRAISTDDRGLRNLPVTWSPGPGMAPLSSMQATNASGYAQAVYATPETEGTYTVAASVGNQNVTFTITVAASSGGGGGSNRVKIVSGQGQVIQVASAVRYPIVAQVVDDNGNPLSGVNVVWRLESLALGEGWLSNLACTGANTFKTCVSDPEGKSGISFTASKTSPPYLQFRIFATAQKDGVDIGEDIGYVTVLPSMNSFVREVLAPAMGTTLALRRGEPLAGAVKVHVTTGMLPGIPNVGITLIPDIAASKVQCVGGTVLSDTAGVATCDAVGLGDLGETRVTIDIGGAVQLLFNVSAKVEAGPPGIIQIIDGNNQTGPPGATLPTPLVAEVRDGAGIPLPGTEATWQVVSPANGATLDPVSSTADANGRISTRVTLGAIAGPVVIRASAGNAHADFTASVVIPVSAFTKAGGDGQSVSVGRMFPPVVVKATAADGGALANIPVTFAVTGDATLSETNVLTGADGTARVTVTAGNTTGPVTITATAPGVPPLTFTLTVKEPTPPVTAASFVNGASFQPGVSPGGIVSIVTDGLLAGIPVIPVGTCLTGGSFVGPLPSTFAGVEVQFADRKAPIFAVCRTGENTNQINIQVPFEISPGTMDVTVRTGVGSGAATDIVAQGLTVAKASPGVFQTTAEGKTIAIAIRPNGSVVTPSNPALAGEMIRIFATGLGPVSATSEAGIPAQKPVFTPVVEIGGTGAGGVTAEYAANTTGVFTITFAVPAVGPGDVPLRLGVVTDTGETVAGPVVTLPVQ